MISKPQALKIARTVVGLCLAGALIYGLYSKSLPRGVSSLIMLAVISFFILSRRSGVYAKNPYILKLAAGSSRRPFRDFGLSVACFLAAMAVTSGIAVAVKHNVLPDNYVTAGLLVAVIACGIVGMIFFISGVIVRMIYGPPPP
jgi:Na+/melibiose symporter-like transporter